VGGHAKRQCGRRHRANAVAVAVVLLGASVAVRAQPTADEAVPATGAATQPAADPVELDRIKVIGTSPAPGGGVERGLLPYAITAVDDGRIGAAHADHLSDFMLRRLPGVQSNEVQGNTFLGDLSYRGFRASPLLGAAQGLSVHVDGVRINEPFGDVVHWELIPEFSVRSLALIPAANPVYGLNTLGGSIALRTHDGRSGPGPRLQAGVGSFGRQRLDASHGVASADGWHAYVAATVFDEAGWRDASGGRLGHAIATLGRHRGPTDASLSLQIGRSRLTGNGLVPAYTFDTAGPGPVRVPDMYALRRDAVYTHPDQAVSRLGQINTTVRHALAGGHEMAAVAYLRHSLRDTVNGDAAEDPDEGATASLNTSATRSRGEGASLALSGASGLHRWQVGASVDSSRSSYRQSEQEATFAADRGVLAGDEPAEPSVSVAGHATTSALYATDTWTLDPRVHATASLRYNRTRVRNALSTIDDSTDEWRDQAEGFTYTSLNPAFGVAYQGGGFGLFANVARNTRVPTVIELGCADPEHPCRLPIGLQSDPYLHQVRSQTFEAGIRSHDRAKVRYSLAAYHTGNRDDILFRSVSSTGQQGYFQNFPRTRYRGIDASVATAQGALALQLAYSHLDATYAGDGLLRQGGRNVQIVRGTRMAGLSRNTMKLVLDWRASSTLSVGGDLQVFSRRIALGNEDGRAGEEGSFPADASSPGFALVNLYANWWPGGQAHDRGWKLFAKVSNVFDRRHETLASLASTVFDAGGGHTGDERDAVFVAPGAPRSLWFGVRHGF
jgi:hypothetical protein